MKIDNDISISNVLQKKTREQLLDEYKDIKENAFYRIFILSALVSMVVLVKIFFSDKTNYLVPGIFVCYLGVEAFSYMARLNKKLDKLYEIEKERDRD
jgi:hypothetical protein